MTARRSDDPSAQDHTHHAASASEYWTPERRHAARPAPFGRVLSSETPAEEKDPGPASEEGALVMEEDGPTCADGSGSTLSHRER